jgi:FeS assembly SUF system protein
MSPRPRKAPIDAQAKAWAYDSSMKPLPVIQSQPDAPVPTSSDLKTAGMVRDVERTAQLEPKIIAAIKTVFDPEIPVNIYDLGLIYEIIVDRDAAVGVRMTLTAPACPAAQWLPAQVEEKVKAVEGVTDARVDVVFDPPWTKDHMSDAAKLQLGLW